MKQILMGVLVAVLCISPALAQTSASDTPVIQVTPETVASGDTIVVTGIGFTPGETVSATIGDPETEMGGFALASAQVAEDGSFTLSFTMPQNWPCCIVATPITQRDLLVIITSDSQPLASAPITYELGWREHYNPTFNFSVMTPPDWTFGSGMDGFSFVMPTPGIQTDMAVVVLTARAVALPQGVDEEAVAAMSLEEYIQASPELELPLAGVTETTIGSLTPVTTANGEEGIVAQWTEHNESGEITASGKTAYFDLNQTVDGSLYRTIQIMSSDPAALVFFDAIVTSFTRGHQQLDACETVGEPASEDVMDVERFIQELCATGVTVVRGGDLPEIAIPIFHAPGQFLIVNGEEMQVYEYPDEASAQVVREDTSPDGLTIGATEVNWATPPHFFGVGRVIVLYAGDDLDVLRLLATVLGPQVAGRPVPDATDEATRITWEEARQLILSGAVEFVFQAHSLEVQLTLNDGRRYSTTEPSIDAVFRVVEDCGDPCAGIGLATE